MTVLLDALFVGGLLGAPGSMFKTIWSFERASRRPLEKKLLPQF